MYKNSPEQRQRFNDLFRRAMKKVIELETPRWELFGVVPLLSERMYAARLCVAEWEGRYDFRFWNGMRSICALVGREFREHLADVLKIKLGRFDSRGREGDDD